MLEKEKMSNKRYYGLDILRVMSMLGIIGLHILGKGGVLDSSKTNIVPSLESSLLNILFYSAVNIFAMLTGYLYINKSEFKRKRIVSIIFITLFWNISILVFYLIMHPSLISNKALIIKAIFPPIAGRGWYITSYIFMFFLIPYINKGLNSINEKAHKKLIIILVLFLSIITSFGFKDYFAINYGYSPFWLIVCYIIGAYIKKYGLLNESKKIKKVFLLITNIAIIYISEKTIAYGTQHFLGRTVGETNFITYVSPFILTNSVLIFLMFKDINVSAHINQRIVLSLSNAAFSVCVAHGHILMMDNYIVNKFNTISKSGALLFIQVIVVVILIYLLWWILDYFRVGFFKVFRVDRLSEIIGKWLDMHC